MKKACYFVLNSKGYKKGAKEDLSKEFEIAGLDYMEGEFGSGPGEILSQVIAEITIKDIWMGLAGSFVYDVIKTTLARAYGWNKKNKNKDNKIKPLINISIYNENKYAFFIKADVEKKYSEKELRKMINEAEKKRLY